MAQRAPTDGEQLERDLGVVRRVHRTQQNREAAVVPQWAWLALAAQAVASKVEQLLKMRTTVLAGSNEALTTG